MKPTDKCRQVVSAEPLLFFFLVLFLLPVLLFSVFSVVSLLIVLLVFVMVVMVTVFIAVVVVVTVTVPSPARRWTASVGAGGCGATVG